ncbi:HD domain-containing protein [Clostridium felsineum]|uniref:3'-5' exoribonuclease YhaM family protein n=1 Tax=Clostridium felsineum TaxID=36839 RepID=UPI00098C8A0C|nr:HD domain-containing protein [Clostridium felsineum]MCR3759067.1 HD domain-containing protein [Clostridium felsineum]URZ00237.1 3'-5' exoribonuclease YhaM [Clostridium felsineum]URZ16748.1 3'-5' exoribonuclease YhaM [Clostridium felsineum DSM 794]
MELKTISELEAGNRIDGFFIIKSVEKRISSNNKKYLDFTFGDKTGDINGKLWDASDSDEDTFVNNILVKVRGTVIEWQNNLQLKIDKIRKTVESDEVKVSDFVPSAPYLADDMYSTILEYVEKVKNDDIKNILYDVLESAGEKIMYWPAAKKNHHSVRSGLLYHTSTMLKAGEKISEVYTFLNTDLIYAGVILHDMAKLEEMESSELGIVTDYSIEGQLLGHIILGVEKVRNSAKKVGADKEISMMLEHMVLSHHYEAEYGSPKKPMFPEAEVLHHLDDMDASMFDMKKALETTDPGEMSDAIWSLDRRRIYKSKFDKNEDK